MIHKDTFFPVSIFFSQFGGIRDVAKHIGLGNQITIKLARLDESDSKGAHCFAINTDGQVTLELPSIRAGTDMLQCKCSSVSPFFSC